MKSAADSEASSGPVVEGHRSDEVIERKRVVVVGLGMVGISFMSVELPHIYFCPSGIITKANAISLSERN